MATMKTNVVSTEAVWSKLSPDLWRFIRRRVPDDHTADDLLQSTFVRIHQSLPMLKNSDQLVGWVYRIARNLVYDHYRCRKEMAPLSESTLAEDEQESDLGSKAVGWLDEMLLQLPDKYRDAVQLAEIEGLSQLAVADRLGLSLSGAKSRVQRGRGLLKKTLDQCCTFHMDRRGNVMDCEPKPGRTICLNCDR